MVDLENLSDNDATPNTGGYNPRLTKQKSSSGLLNERGRGSALGLPQGLHGTALAQQESQNPFNFGKPNLSQFHHSKSGGLAMSRSQQVFGKADDHTDEEGSHLNDDNITNDLVDQDDDSWDEKLKAQIQRQINARKGGQQNTFNIRKVTADFSNYFVSNNVGGNPNDKQEEEKLINISPMFAHESNSSPTIPEESVI